MNFLIILILIMFPFIAHSEGPSCSETPISIEKLEDIVKSDSVHSMQDFLEKIPKDTMQLFTFVTNSLSLHRGSGEGKVSPMWPRVLRSTSDGKITISFVCDPRNPTYGKVEALFFDDKSNRVKAVEWNFGPDGKNIKTNDRIQKDPVSCISCHRGSEIQGQDTLKYNFSEYNTWGDCDRTRGITMYGSNDDSMSKEHFRIRQPSSSFHLPEGCDSNKDLSAFSDEVEDYQKFRQLQKDNSCFNSLPWSKDKNNVYYPYSKTGQLGKISERPNLIFTAAYGQLMAKKIHSILKQEPNYELMKYLIPMENLSCPDVDSYTKLKKVMGKGKKLTFGEDLIYSYSKIAGVDDKDWTMEFLSDEKNSKFKVADNTMANLVQNEIINEIKSKRADYKAPIYSYLEDTTMSCIPISSIKNDITCDELKLQFDKAYEKFNSQNYSNTPCESSVIKRADEHLKEKLNKIVDLLTQKSIDNGRKLVQPDSKGKCISCHSIGSDSGLPTAFRFVPDEKSSKKEINESISILKKRMPELSNKIDHRLIRTKTMPPIENMLTDEERLDIKNYINSLTK